MKVNLENTYEAVSSSGEAGEFSLGDFLSFGERTLLFFYPKDNTPGCTTENKDFSGLIQDFAKLGIVVIGVSKDSVTSHQNFITTEGLKVDLLCDPELILHKELGAYGEKNNYGKIVEGVIRSTFLLNGEGEVLQEWKNIKATGHAQRVLKQIQEMKK